MLSSSATSSRKDAGSPVSRAGAARAGDLLVSDAEGRTIVQAKRWTGMVRNDAVHRAVVARAKYGVPRRPGRDVLELFARGRHGSTFEWRHLVEPGGARRRTQSL